MKQIENYLFFEKEAIYFVYDFENNIIYTVNSKKDFDDTFEFLSSNGESKTSNVNDKQLEFIRLLLDKKVVPKKFDTFAFLKNNLNTRGVTLMIAQDCNLRCSYCYGSDGNYGGTPRVMDKQTAEACVDYLVNRSDDNAHIQITFFGGEPLINFEIIKHVVEYVKKIEKDNKRFSYTITTNGTLITDEIAMFFKSIPISIMISIDGEAHIHDKYRRYPNNKGTHKVVIRSIEFLKKHNIVFVLRATFDHDSVLNMEETINYLFNLGANNVYIARLSKYDTKSDLFDINSDELLAEWDYRTKFFKRTMEELLEEKTPKYIPFYNMFDRLTNATKDLVGCAIMKGSTAISTEGNLYPCHRFVGINGFIFGDVYNGISLDKIKTIADEFDLKTEECTLCFARYICKRACVRDIAKENAKFIKFDNTYCDVMKEAVINIIFYYFVITKTNPTILQSITRRQNTIQTL